MKLISTRNAENKIAALDAVLKGIASDGGLFVPEVFPAMDKRLILGLGENSYAEAAAKVLGLFFDEIEDEDLRKMAEAAYAHFDDVRVAPVKKLTNKEYILELFHGPTLAFKDMALQILPRLMSEALKNSGSKENILILTATSGDTGKAALEGFRDVSRTKIAVFYPEEGVSDMQKLQMVTQPGKNTYVCAVRGNFDDAQTGVKKMFADIGFNERVKARGYQLSSANSINFGRLAPQIAYYIYAYAKLVSGGHIQVGETINITVPTGNFGNILAAYYAKKMGLPVSKLICASNSNNVLTDFFESGKYVTNRMFFKTMSPSMDILISSNLERLLFEVCERNAAYVRELMQTLGADGEYTLDFSSKGRMVKDFYADYADELRTARTIKDTFRKHGYLLDPHTAVAKAVYENYLQHTGDSKVNLIVSTASPFKFVQDVLRSLTGEAVEEPFEAARRLAEASGSEVPGQISALQGSDVRFMDVAEKEELADVILNIL